MSHRIGKPLTWLLPLRCDRSGYALQPGVRSLVQPDWRRAEPPTPVSGPRPSAHGDQVTPGPTGNQLGGHGAVKHRDGEARRSGSSPSTPLPRRFVQSLSFHCDAVLPASSPPCSGESRGLRPIEPGMPFTHPPTPVGASPR